MVKDRHVVDAFLHGVRQGIVRAERVGKISRAFPVWAFDRVNDGGAVRRIAVGDVGMPECGPLENAKGSSVFENVRQHENCRVPSQTEVVQEVRVLATEALGEPVELLEFELLVPDDDHLVFMEDVEELPLGVVVHGLREVDAQDLDAEGTG